MSFGKSCKAKVNYFDHICFGLNEDVVQLDVSVRNMVVVKIFKGACYLFEELSAGWLRYLSFIALGLDEGVKTHAINIVRN